MEWGLIIYKNNNNMKFGKGDYIVNSIQKF